MCVLDRREIPELLLHEDESLDFEDDMVKEVMHWLDNCERIMILLLCVLLELLAICLMENTIDYIDI